MPSRTVFLVLIAVALAAVLVTGRQQAGMSAAGEPSIAAASSSGTGGAPRPERRRVSRDGIQYLDARPTSVLRVPPGEMVDALEQTYRLRPDRRFLLAVRMVHTLLANEPATPLTVDFANGRWTLDMDETPVGELPPLPSFTDARRLLEARAAELSAARPVVWEVSAAGDVSTARRLLDEFTSFGTADALALLGDEWTGGRPHPEHLVLAARGLIALALQAHDPMELTDALPARALAVLATLSTAHEAPEADRWWALLAHLMGYSEEAAALAGALPAEDPIRLYVERRTDELRRQAELPSADPLAQHLYLKRLADRGHTGTWMDWIRGHAADRRYDLGLIRTGFDVGAMESNGALSGTVPYLVMGEVWRATASPHAPRYGSGDGALYDAAELLRLIGEVERTLRGGPPALLARFESELGTLDERYDGPFLPAEDYRDYFRAFMYGSFHRYALFVLDQYGSVDAAHRLVAALDSVPPGPGIEVARWHAALARSMGGARNVDELVATVAARRVGVGGLARAFEEIRTRTSRGDHRVFLAGKLLAKRLDSRPPHQSSFAWILLRDLQDLPRSERHYQRVAELDGRERSQIVLFHRRMTGRYDEIRATVDDPEVPPATRARALDYLLYDSVVSHDAARDRFRALLEADPDLWSLHSRYFDYLIEAADWPGLAEAAARWLATHDESQGLRYVEARTALARAADERGDHAAAWRAIEPVLASGQGGALSRGSLILAGLGRHDEARELARSTTRRYPYAPWTWGRLARLHWTLGEDDEAVRVLADARHQQNHTGDDWARDVAPAFAEVFAERPPHEATTAVEALHGAGVPLSHLQSLPYALAEREAWESAFQAASAIRASHVLESVYISLQAYGHLIRARGRHAAVEWLRSRLPGSLAVQGALLLYESGHTELLWELFDDPGRGDLADFAWLMRAAAAVEEGLDTHPRRAELLAHYRRGRSDPYHVMGRYLVGLSGEDEMVALMTAPDRRCEVSYYLGVRALGEGRYRDASDWFRVVTETGLTHEGEYRWAYGRLLEWSQRGWSLERALGEAEAPAP